MSLKWSFDIIGLLRSPSETVVEEINYEANKKFATKESATHAIVAVHNTDIGGQPVKCSWGKESGDPNNAPPTTQAMASTQYPYTYGQQMGYWYPQTASYPAAAAATTAAAQMQAGQFMQQAAAGYTAAPFGQYGGYQQAAAAAGYMGMASLQMPAATWQGLPAQPAMPAAQASAAALQQPPGLMAFPAMQAGYQ
ncbi:Nucleolysin TIA-1, partial [Frankliniella fusca]